MQYVQAAAIRMDAGELLESSSESSEDGHLLSSESKDGCSRSTSTSTSNRFNPRQRAVLNSYYRMGMVGTGKVYSFRHERAAAELGCTVDKVKRWIKKKNRRVKHTRTQNDVIPAAKRVKLTPWQAYMKDFGQTDEGKDIMKTRGTKEFAQTASRAYKSITASQKEELRKKCSEEAQPLTVKDIKRDGRKIFKNMDKQLQQLQDLGYSGFSFGFFEEDVHFVGTADSTACSHPKVIQFLMALITASNPPKIIDILPECQSTSLPSTTSKGKVPPPGSSKERAPASSSRKRKLPSASTKGKAPSSSANDSPSSSNHLLSLLSSSQKSLPDRGTESPPPTAAVESPTDGEPEAVHSPPPYTTSKGNVPLSGSSKGTVSAFSSSKSASTKGKAPSSSSNTGKDSPSSNNLFCSQESLPDKGTTESPPSTAVEPPSNGEPEAVHSPPPTADVQSKGVTATVHVLDSPAKPDQNIWMEKLELYIRDRVILESSDKWLNDNIVRAAQFLLRKQSKGRIVGWQHTQCAKKGFMALPAKSTFIQILHVSSCHWILVSNVNPRDRSGFFNSVGIYDSNRMMSVSKSLKNEICSFVKPACDLYTFDIMNIQTQTNGSDCGLFAIACATELVDGCDPVLCHWDQAQMRPHLMQCLIEEKMLRFPCTKRRRIPFGQRVRKSEMERLFCTCRLANDKKRPMIECTSCRRWFHNDCIGLGNVDVKELRWKCTECSQALA